MEQQFDLDPCFLLLLLSIFQYNPYYMTSWVKLVRSLGCRPVPDNKTVTYRFKYAMLVDYNQMQFTMIFSSYLSSLRRGEP